MESAELPCFSGRHPLPCHWWGLARLLCIMFLAQSGVASASDPTRESRLHAADMLLQQGREHLARHEYPTALSSLDESIRVLESINGVSDPAIIDALLVAVDAQVGLQRPDLAIPLARRAINIVRRSGGLYDLRQQPILELLAELQALTGHPEDSLADLHFLERASEESQGRQSLAHARILGSVGQWLCRLGDFQNGRERFRSAYEVLRAVNGDDAARLQSLTGMAQCFLFELAAYGVSTAGTLERPYLGPVVRSERMLPGTSVFQRHVEQLLRYEGEKALIAAGRLAEKSQTLPIEVRVDALLQAGDWFLIKNYTRAASDYYSRAYVLARKESVGAEMVLVSPLQIMYADPAIFARARDAGRAERFVVAEFTTRADGRVQAIQITEHEATRSMVDQTRTALLAARYRPVYADGKPVHTSEVRFRQAF